PRKGPGVLCRRAVAFVPRPMRRAKRSRGLTALPGASTVALSASGRWVMKRCWLMALMPLIALSLSAPLIAQQAPVRTPLWAHGAPGFEDRAGIPERVEDYWTKGVNNPGITAFLPAPANATGTAIVVVPGGGHQLLVT